MRRELGQGPQSLAPDQEAVALLRELAATDKGQRRNLGRALTGLGLSYGAMGRLEESLAISQEAAAMAREVAQTNSQYRLDLANALNNLGLAYGDAGRRQEALAPTQEAVSLYRELVKTQPAHRAKLSGSLSNLGKAHGELGRALNNLGYPRLLMGQRDQARALLGESLELVRPLAASNPHYQGDLRRTMANLDNLKR